MTNTYSNISNFNEDMPH